MLSNFIECMNKKSIKPICSAKEALKNIEIAIKANENKIGVIIQARTGSKRLPNKVLKKNNQKSKYSRIFNK